MWLFAGQGVSLFLQAAYFIALARLLGTTQYGLLAGAVSFIAVVSQYSTMGSGLLFLRYVCPDHSQFRSYWGNILLSSFLVGGFMCIGVRVAGQAVLGPGSASLLIPLAIADCLFQQFISCTGQVFQTFEKLKISAMISLIGNLLRTVVAATLLFTVARVSAAHWAIAAMSVSGIASLVAFVAVTYHFGWPSFSLKLMAQRAKEGFIFALSGSTTAVYNDIDKVVLSHEGLNRENGIYSMAYRIINIGTMPVMSLVSAAFPRFFREGVEGISAVAPLARQLLQRTLFLAVPVAVLLFVCAPLIPLIVGQQYAESVRALRWLCLIPLFRCFHLSAGDAIAGAGHQTFRLISQSIAAGGNLLLNLLLVEHYSWLGAAWASLATDAALGVMNWGALYYLGTLPRPASSLVGS